jgi:hypothetical protein
VTNKTIRYITLSYGLFLSVLFIAILALAAFGVIYGTYNPRRTGGLFVGLFSSPLLVYAYYHAIRRVHIYQNANNSFVAKTYKYMMPVHVFSVIASAVIINLDSNSFIRGLSFIQALPILLIGVITSLISLLMVFIIVCVDIFGHDGPNQPVKGS